MNEIRKHKDKDGACLENDRRQNPRDECSTIKWQKPVRRRSRTEQLSPRTEP